MTSEYGTLIISLIFSFSCFTMLIVGMLATLFVLALAGYFDVVDHEEIIVKDARKAMEAVRPWETQGYTVVTAFVSDDHGKALVIHLERKRRKLFR